jgi:hypothetical protein
MTVITFYMIKKKFSSPPVSCFHGLYICLSALALLFGGMIYILFRPSEPVFFNWILDAGFDTWFNMTRHGSLPLGHLLPGWFVYSLPNGFWAFAYALIITAIWSGSKSWLKYIWMATIPILVLGYEMLQYPGIIPGTFCIQDMALGIAGMVTGIIIGLKTIKSNHYEKTIKY